MLIYTNLSYLAKREEILTKYYAVKNGKTTGVFENWDDCKASTNGFSNPQYKAFNTLEEAEAYLEDKDLLANKINEDIKSGYVVAFCDGSFDKEKNKYSYGVLIIDLGSNQHEIYGAGSNTKYLSSHNIIGEIFGAINAMDWAISNGYSKIKIYHDYEGLSKWITGEWKANADAASRVQVQKQKILLHNVQ